MHGNQQFDAHDSIKLNIKFNKIVSLKYTQTHDCIQKYRSKSSLLFTAAATIYQWFSSTVDAIHPCVYMKNLFGA